MKVSVALANVNTALILVKRIKDAGWQWRELTDAIISLEECEAELEDQDRRGRSNVDVKVLTSLEERQ